MRPLETWLGWLAGVAMLGVLKAIHSWVRVYVAVIKRAKPLGIEK